MLNWVEHEKSFVISWPWLSEVGGEGGGGRGDLGVIVVWMREPVFRNLPHSYTWPLEKKRTHLYNWSSKMLTYTTL